MKTTKTTKTTETTETTFQMDDSDSDSDFAPSEGVVVVPVIVPVVVGDAGGRRGEKWKKRRGER